MFTFSLAISGCGGGSSNGQSDSSIVIIDSQALNIDLTSGSYSVASSAGSTPANSGEININTPAEGAVILTDGENPILMAMSTGNISSTLRLNAESSAIALVLLEDRFTALENVNITMLMDRIKTHVKFPELVNEITTKIQSGSSCPLNPACNIPAAMLSYEIAEAISLDGVI